MREDWLQTTIGEVAEVVSGGTPKTKEPAYWEGGDIPWLTPTEVTAKDGQVIFDTDRKITNEGLQRSAARMLPVETVLFTSRATIGAVALAGVPMCTNQGFKSLIANEDLVLPRFLMYWVQMNRAEFESRASGSTFLEINKANVQAVPVLLPPLDEQHRIVDLIEHVDGALSACEAQLALARQTGRTLRADMLSQSDSFVPLGEFADVRMGRQRSPKDHDGDHMIPYLRSANVKNNRLELSDVKEMNFTPEEQATFELRSGDVLVTEGSGSIDEVGASTAWSNEIPSPVGFQNTLIRLRSKDEGVAEQRYLLELSRWAYESGLWLDIASGTNIKHIGSRRAAAARVPLLPVSQQRTLCEQAEAVDAVVDAGERHHQVLVKVRAQVLRAALSGEINFQETYDRFLKDTTEKVA